MLACARFQSSKAACISRFFCQQRRHKRVQFALLAAAIGQALFQHGQPRFNVQLLGNAGFRQIFASRVQSGGNLAGQLFVAVVFIGQFFGG